MAKLKYGEQNGRDAKPAAKANRLAERLAAGMRGEQPDWGRIPAELVWKFIQRCCEDDGAVMFGYSRDGGAYSLKIYAGGDPEKVYVHTDAELIDIMTYLMEE